MYMQTQEGEYTLRQIQTTWYNKNLKIRNTPRRLPASKWPPLSCGCSRGCGHRFGVVEVAHGHGRGHGGCCSGLLLHFRIDHFGVPVPQQPINLR